MSKQLAKLTVRFKPGDKAVAFLRLDGVGIRQFEQLSIQYRRINKVDTATKSAIIRWIRGLKSNGTKSYSKASMVSNFQAFLTLSPNISNRFHDNVRELETDSGKSAL